ncbi:GIY-YIG nuclease family protein [Desulfurobacterium thermolithotrophum]|uniref:GIY-YIG nuclease family protein n=1 Tax=Desulfurobacterium thermolithotrophum TaxID=64160 RepID=UPI0013D6ADC3
MKFKVRSGREFSLKSGYYIYVGSAFGSGGLRKRISRHLKKEKKKHWHLDFISTDSSFKAFEVWVIEDKKVECFLANSISKTEKTITGFGSTDCKCPSHLFRVSEIENLRKRILEEFNVKIFKI